MCRGCGKEYPEEEFLRIKKGKPALRSKCRPCRAREGKEYRERIGPEGQREIKRRYYSVPGRRAREARRHKYRQWGYDPDVVEGWVEAHGLYCDLCGQDRDLVVDHDHETLEIRGLLCSQCNCGLGNLRDDVEIMTKAINYLEQRGMGPDCAKKAGW